MDGLDEMWVPERYTAMAAAAKKSRTAAVRLYCLQCSGWVFNEVRDCIIPTCPLYPWRLGSPQRALKSHRPRKTGRQITDGPS